VHPNRHIKRSLDVTLSVAVLGLSSPLLALAAASIRATMGSPVLFRQERPGKDGKPFVLLKFRTMNEVRDADGRAVKDEARLTRVGRFLRATSIDELPQLWNVLRGDMSLVGPRPLLMQYLPRYSRQQARRHDVSPGITGWAQVNGRNSLSWDEKFALDVWYVDHCSVVLDLRILALTALRVLQHRGIANDGHATMPEFMGAKDNS
jgi:lipopolysaccharide/colanic/teichoic acid biosynthesis glycosyltransferase